MDAAAAAVEMQAATAPAQAASPIPTADGSSRCGMTVFPSTAASNNVGYVG